MNVAPIDTASLPEGAQALVGKIGYTITDLPIGGSASISFELPQGAEPNVILKEIGGKLVDVTSLATISGRQVTLKLTDGGLGDEDGTANGTITDPVVPEHATRRLPQVIEWPSAPPRPPSLGVATRSTLWSNGACRLNTAWIRRVRPALALSTQAS